MLGSQPPAPHASLRLLPLLFFWLWISLHPFYEDPRDNTEPQKQSRKLSPLQVPLNELDLQFLLDEWWNIIGSRDEDINI